MIYLHESWLDSWKQKLKDGWINQYNIWYQTEDERIVPTCEKRIDSVFDLSSVYWLGGYYYGQEKCTKVCIFDRLPEILWKFVNYKPRNSYCIATDDINYIYMFHISDVPIPKPDFDYCTRSGELGKGFYVMFTIEGVWRFWYKHPRSHIKLDKVNVYKCPAEYIKIQWGGQFIWSIGGQTVYKTDADWQPIEFIGCYDRMWFLKEYESLGIQTLDKFLHENHKNYNL